MLFFFWMSKTFVKKAVNEKALQLVKQIQYLTNPIMNAAT